MQDKIASAMRRCLLSVTSVPHIIKKYPLPFIVLCFKLLLSAAATLSGDFMAVARHSVNPGYPFGSYASYTAWVYLLKVDYYFWLALPIEHPDLAGLPNQLFVSPDLSVRFLLLLFKLPTVVSDVLTGFLVYKIVMMKTNSHKVAYNTFRAWFYNPAVTLLAEMFGSIDIVATMLLLACIYCFMRNRILLSSILLLICVIFRTYALLVLPVLFIMLYKREEGRRRNIAILITIIVVPIVAMAVLLTLVTNGAFLRSVTVGQGDYWFFLGPLLFPLYTSLDQPIALTVALYVLFLFIIYDREDQIGKYREDPVGSSDVISYVFMLLLALFAFSVWNPQFLLWILPFVTLNLGLEKSSRKLLYSFTLTAMLWTIIYNGRYFTNSGQSLFFIPNFHPIMEQLSHWLSNMRGSEIISKTYFLTVLKSMFTAVCILYLLMRYMKLTFSTKSTLTRTNIPRKDATKRVGHSKMPLPTLIMEERPSRMEH